MGTYTITVIAVQRHGGWVGLITATNNAGEVVAQLYNDDDPPYWASEIDALTGLLCHPPTMDEFMDFGNKLFVIIELKHGDAKMPYGQKLALTRLCDAMNVPCWLLVARHDTPPDEDIDVAAANVVNLYAGEQWYTPREPLTVFEAVDGLRKSYGI